MKKRYIWLTMIIILIAGGIFLYPKPVEHAPLPLDIDEATTDLSHSEDTTTAQPPEVRHPVPQTPAPAIQPPSPQQADIQQPPQPLAPLPEFEKSDDFILKSLSKLFETYPLQQLFRDANIISRIVVTVDNLPRRRISPAQFPTKPVKGVFMALGEEGQQVLSEKNYLRYAIYVDMLENVDQKKMINAYFYMYPLFQQAYLQLGYQDVYFNDRLVETIDDLLKAPEITQTIKLTRTSVMFKFAEAELEALSAGQKIMIRMGPDNAKRVKNLLRSIRELLIVGDTPTTAN